MSRPQRLIGLLTGTFDPVHLGHIAMAEAARAAFGLDEVWFLVNPDPGHKVGVTNFADRVAMVRLAIEGTPGLREGAPGPGGLIRHRMADFERLMATYPGWDFVFIVGSDVLTAMTDWEDYEPAVARVRFVVALRAGAGRVELEPRLRAQVFEFTNHTDASSRTIQGQLPGGECPAELDERVYAYIRKRGLYQP